MQLTQPVEVFVMNMARGFTKHICQNTSLVDTYWLIVVVLHWYLIFSNPRKPLSHVWSGFGRQHSTPVGIITVNRYTSISQAWLTHLGGETHLVVQDYYMISNPQHFMEALFQNVHKAISSLQEMNHHRHYYCEHQRSLTIQQFSSPPIFCICLWWNSLPW